MTPLGKELEAEPLAIYEKAGTVGYWPRYFKRMLTSANPRFYRVAPAISVPMAAPHLGGAP